MSKTITSPIPEFSGTITIPERLTIPQCLEIEKGFGEPNSDPNERVWFTTTDARIIPALLAIVEKWDIENLPTPLTFDNFPASPRGLTHKFIMWVWDEIKKVYFGNVNVPNE